MFGPPAELHWNVDPATCEEIVKLVEAPEQISGWAAGATTTSGMGLMWVRYADGVPTQVPMAGVTV
jgi:hypothetical protein